MPLPRRKLRLLWTFALVTVAFGSWCTFDGRLAASIRTRQPLIEFESHAQEIHEVVGAEGAVVRNVAFKFTNIGRTPLLISKVTSSCGCTVVDLPPQIAPSGVSRINATATIPSGVVDTKIVSLVVESNAANEPVAQLSLILRVEQKMVVSTESINFGNVEPGRSYARPFTVEAEVPSDRVPRIAFRASEATSWRLAASRRREVLGRLYERLSGTVELKAPNEVGLHQETVEFFVAGSPAVRRTVEIDWKTVASCRIEPGQMCLTDPKLSVAGVLFLPETIGSDLQLQYDRELISVSLTGEGGRRRVSVTARVERSARRETSVQVMHDGTVLLSFQVVVALEP
jgi:hypothetical protein